MTRAALLLLLTLGSAAPGVVAAPATPDPAVQRAVEAARARFLAAQPFKRLNLSVWVQDAPGSAWRGGEVDATAQVYPASMVKLPFAIDAVLACRERGQPMDCLHADVVPMLVDSDNVATGRVVDAITRTVNAESATPAEEAAWREARLHTERRLAGWGLLGGMRLFTKTYPTNSGEEPAGLEARARLELGRNSMSATDAARLMRALVDGEIDRWSGAPVRDTLWPLLTRPRFGLQSALAPGTPPGTRVWSKIGSAFDTLEEVAYLELPGTAQQAGARVVIAAFSDGLDQDTPIPFDSWRLGDLTTAVLDSLGLITPAPALAPTQRRGAIARWTIKLPPGRHELVYAFPAADLAAPAGLRRLRVTASGHAIAWAWPAARVAARPLWVGDLVGTPGGSVVDVEVELESATAPAGTLRLNALPEPAP